MRADAEAYAEEVKRSAKSDARDIIAEAHDAARGVLHDGTSCPATSKSSSDSLRRNAERLLNDVKLAHARLTADLDQATPAGAGGPGAAGLAPAPSRPTAHRPPARRAAAAPTRDFEVPGVRARPSLSRGC